MIRLWLRGIARRPGRLSAVTIGVALAVGLLATLGGFLSSSKATMTARSLTKVAVDWQIEVQPKADPTTTINAIRSAAAFPASEIVGYGTANALSSVTGSTTQTTGTARVLGISATYRTSFPGSLRTLVGADQGVLLAQQTAANLHAGVGDSITIDRPGFPPVDVRVAGVVELPTIDSLFQTVGAPSGAQPLAPPDNVVLLPLDQWHELFDPLASTRPDLVRTQLHARLDHHLPTDPAGAYSTVTARARNLELKMAGTALVGDNLAATLAGARTDALYAQVLFLFLGAPAAILAGLLTAMVAGSGADRRRAEQALLRARGATVNAIGKVAMVETALVTLTGGGLGLIVALITTRLAFGSWRLGPTTLQTVGWAAGALALGAAIAVLVIARPARRDARGLTIAGARSSRLRAGQPRWQRMWLDVVLLGGAAIVFWVTSRNGYHLVLAPEGVATVSVSYWAFAGPALAWAGGGLLTLRIVETGLRRGRRPLAAAIRPVAGPLANTVSASLSRQRLLVARAAALAMLALTFAVSTAMFNATYRHQAEIDAVLTNGADVTVTQPPGSSVGPTEAARYAKIAGVSKVEPVQHRYAYVGADLQDLYGVHPTTIVGAGKLQDAYVAGGRVATLFSRLAAQPDAILVSAETVKDFQLLPGDQLTLRLQDTRTNNYTNVVFHYVGVVKEFPTAPRDSFLIANATYVAKMTGSDAVNTFLIDASGKNPRVIADRLRTALGATATVTDITSSRTIVGSSLTAVDLAGLTRVELAYALALAVAASGLTLWLGLAERQRTFAIAAALGARSRQVGAFVWIEAAIIALAAVVLGGAGGWALTHLLVKVLTGVFDPAPSALTVPIGYLATVAAVLVGAVAVAARAGIMASQRDPLATLRSR